MFEKESQRSYHEDPDRVFQALRACAADAQQVLEADDEALAVTFQTKRTLVSWGHVVTAQVLGEAEGARVELVVTGLPDAPRALMDGKKNASMAARVLDDIRTRLP
ncbi:hypothetical protein [Brevibacterium yomogidense]|uniref:hypothetical protein n=1 Tax=Brevibacterium yomogidense TaxID=946573 RepID=UPI0018DEF153|nr:hypothetical protein [Brevibacterium yomogidense]